MSQSIAQVWTLRTAITVAAFAATVVQAQALLPESLPDNVVARRGGVDLTLHDVDVKMRTMPVELRAGYLEHSDRAAKLIDSTLLTKQIALRAEELGLDDDPVFKEELALAARELLSRTLIDRTVEQAKVPNVEALAEERYIANPAAVTPAPRIDVSHLLVATDGMDEAAAKQMAEAALVRAEAGETFADIVASIGDEKVTTQGIQMVEMSRMDPTFARAVSSMKAVGDLTGPVRSRYGYHIIRLERLDVLPTPPFAAVKARMVAELEAAARDKVRRDFLASFSQLDTQLNDEIIQSLRSRYVDAGVAAGAGSSTTASPPAAEQP